MHQRPVRRRGGERREARQRRAPGREHGREGEQGCAAGNGVDHSAEDPCAEQQCCRPCLPRPRPRLARRNARVWNGCDRGRSARHDGAVRGGRHTEGGAEAAAKVALVGEPAMGRAAIRPEPAARRGRLSLPFARSFETCPMAVTRLPRPYAAVAAAFRPYCSPAARMRSEGMARTEGRVAPALSGLRAREQWTSVARCGLVTPDLACSRRGALARPGARLEAPRRRVMPPLTVKARGEGTRDTRRAFR